MFGYLMKTNHQRDFKETRRRIPEEKNPMFVRFYQDRKLELSDKGISVAVDHQDGHPHNGIARARKGAKHHLNSTERHLENAALNQIVKEIK